MPNPIADPLVENVIAEDLTDLVRLEASPEGVAVVTLNRPHHGNAFDGQTIIALREAFETLHGADHVRVVFLRGEGGTFCSGLDQDWMQVISDWSEADHRDDARAVGEMLKALSDIPAVTVALVEGAATGGGAGLVAVCDLAVATADARFAFGEVRQGLIPAMVAPFVVNAIGPRAAKALFITGRAFGAEHAQRIGLVQEIVADAAGLSDALTRITDEVMLGAPGAVQQAKALAWEAWGRPIDRDLIDDMARRLAKRRTSDEGREGVAAATQGRPPVWG